MIDGIVLTIISAIIGAVLGAFCSRWIVEANKKAKLKKTMLNLLKIELMKFSNKERTTANTFRESIWIPVRPHVIWNIISADILDHRREQILIKELHELVSWMESFNNVINLNNSALIQGNVDSQIPQMCIHYKNKTYTQAQKVLGILEK